MSRARGIGRLGLDYLMEVVFPPTCAGCGTAGAWICLRCERDLERLDLLQAGSHVSQNSQSLVVVARFAYADPVRKAIHLLKYRGERARAIWFAGQVAPLVSTVDPEHAILEPVPLTRRRERKRGFNQSHEIARHLAESTGVAVGGHLVRVRETRPQVELSGPERLANVRGAFESGSGVAGKQVILIDDVVTTGSTMRECAIACFAAGAAAVVGVAAASGVD